MLLTSLVWAYITLLTYIYGMFVYSIINRQLKNNFSLPVPLLLFAGLIFLTWLAAVFSLFMRIYYEFHIILFIGACIIIIFLRNTFIQHLRLLYFEGNPSIKQLIGFSAIFTVILLYSVAQLRITDAGLYHAATIRWTEVFPVVPGLGNLHGRLAFNSLWLVSSAVFSLSFLKIQPFLALNGWFLLILCTYCLEKISEFSEREITISKVISFLIIILSLLFPFPFISSASPDVPAIGIVWFCLLLFVEILQSELPFNKNPKLFILTLLVFFAVTVKLSSLPLLLIPFYFFIIILRTRNWKQFVYLFLPAIVLLIPWFVRSYYLSGYLIYPVASINVFNPDWKMAFTKVDEEAKRVTSWARIPSVRYQEVLSMRFKEWVPVWFNRNKDYFYFNLLIISIILSIPATFLLFLKEVKSNYKQVKISYGYIYLFAGVIFWFINGPDIRFGYGYLSGLFILLMAQTVSWISGLNSKLVRKVLSPSLILSFTVYMILVFGVGVLKNYDVWALNDERLITQVKYPIANVVTEMIYGQNYYSASDGLCWGLIPCAPGQVNPNLVLRGETLKEGFRIINQ